MRVSLLAPTMNRMRMRSWRIVAGGVTAFVLLGCYASPAPYGEPDRWPGPVAGVCSVERLGSVPGAEPDTWIELDVMDPTARYVGAHQWLPGGGYVPVVWDNGVPRVLDEESGTVVAVNSRGWAVVATGPDRYWVSTASGPTPLPPPEGYRITLYARDINELGDVVGVVHNPPAGDRTAVVWSPAPDGAYLPRILPGPSDADPFAILDDGTVLGRHGSAVYLWEPDGSGREVTPPEGVVLDRMLGRNGDWVLVGAQPRDDPPRLARWNVRTGDVTFHEYFNVAKLLHNPAVSPRGLAFAGAPAILVVDGKAYELPLPPDSRDRWVAEPAVVSADGTVVAGTVSDHGTRDGVPRLPVLWRCSAPA